MSGASKAYLFQVFPLELGVKEWIQVYPDLWDFIDHVNDLLSFYKEELDGEDVNFVSMSAQAKGVTKVEALQQLADGMAEAYHRGSELLGSCAEAWNAYRAFCVGYVALHAASPRYKLDQLNL